MPTLIPTSGCTTQPVLADLKGQESVNRAPEIAAAGGQPWMRPTYP
jgi:predicted ATPase with chaperone activity